MELNSVLDFPELSHSQVTVLGFRDNVIDVSVLLGCAAAQLDN
jgi:hypothetical protein